MGAFFQRIHVRTNGSDQATWLFPAMKQLGFQLVEEEDVLNLLLQVSGAWTTLHFVEEDLDPSLLLSLAEAISACFSGPCLSVECVDSDFVQIGLFQAGVQVDAGVIGTFYDGQAPMPNSSFWQELVKPEETFSFLNLFTPDTSFVFAEDALQELYPLLGIDCDTEFCPQIGDNSQAVYFQHIQQG